VALSKESPDHARGIALLWHQHHDVLRNGYALLAGAMPRRQQHLILAWTELHQEELLENWDRVAQEDVLNQIKGLN
jgi:hypothetical protein